MYPNNLDKFCFNFWIKLHLYPTWTLDRAHFLPFLLDTSTQPHVCAAAHISTWWSWWGQIIQVSIEKSGSFFKILVN